jgi:probable HAF family extracellular repeat protein
MKSRFSTCIAAFTLLAALAIPAPLAAQGQKTNFRHYKLIDMGTFGGPSSFLLGSSQVLNNPGSLVGWADTTTPESPEFCFSGFQGEDGFAQHAFQWQGGTVTDLGTLPGGQSSQAVWVSSNGLIAGNSENGEIDPLLPGIPEARAVLWQHGQIIDLGTFGGNESMVAAVNSRGQVAGAALNTTPDPFSLIDFLYCLSSNGTQARAFLWQDGQKQDLGTLGTGNDALPAFVNEAGQVAGYAYTNSIPNPTTGLPTFHPFLWDKKKGMQDLGSFGGTAVFTVSGLNQYGEVVGTMTLPGDATWDPFLWDGEKLIDLGGFGGDHNWGNWINEAGDVVGQGSFPGDQIFHGFLWKKGKMTDLGLLPGDDYSDTTVINSRGQIVGGSGNSASLTSSAVLWVNGQIVDLNTLVTPGSGLTLSVAVYINDPGEIAAFAVDSSGNNHDVLLIPCDEHHPGVEGCDYSMVDAPAAAPQTSPAVRNASSWALHAPRVWQRPFGRHFMPWYRGLGAQPVK